MRVRTKRGVEVLLKETTKKKNVKVWKERLRLETDHDTFSWIIINNYSCMALRRIQWGEITVTCYGWSFALGAARGLWTRVFLRVKICWNVMNGFSRISGTVWGYHDVTGHRPEPPDRKPKSGPFWFLLVDSIFGTFCCKANHWQETQSS